MSLEQFNDGSGQATECRRKLRRQLESGHKTTTTICGGRQAVVDDVGRREEVVGTGSSAAGQRCQGTSRARRGSRRSDSSSGSRWITDNWCVTADGRRQRTVMINLQRHGYTGGVPTSASTDIDGFDRIRQVSASETNC